jgi:hypothetical protein
VILTVDLLLSLHHDGILSSVGRYCCSSIERLLLLPRNVTSSNQEAYLLSVDLVKAFDSLNREEMMMWQRILAKKFGIPVIVYGH